MTAYATRADLYRYGFPRGLLANPGRMIAAANATTNLLELDGHGFEDGDALLFRAEEGGSLPSPLVAGTTYYAKRLTDSTFQVSATVSGAALDLTSAGSSIIVSTSLEPTIDAELEACSRIADTYVPAHAAPFTAPYPAEIVRCVAKLAAASLLEITGQSSALIQAGAAQTREELKRLATGIPLRDPLATAQTNLAVGRTVDYSTSGGYSGSIP